MTVLNFPASPTPGDTYTENGVLYTWNGSYWDAADSDSFDDRYVEVIGDTMTGQLTLPGGGSAAQALQRQEIESLVTSGDHWDRSGGTLSPEVSSDNVNIGGGKITLNADGSAFFSNRVGIGETSPSEKLEIGRASNVKINLRSNNDGIGICGLHFGDTSSATSGRLIYNHKIDSMAFFVNESERLDINSSGDVLIGGTLPASPNISLNADGSAFFNGGDLLIDDNNHISQFGKGGSGRSSQLSIAASQAGNGGRSLITAAVGATGINTGNIVFDIQDHGNLVIGDVTGTQTIGINGSDGTASFTGNVLIGDTLPSAPNISLNADGSAEFAGGKTFILSDGYLQGERNNVSGILPAFRINGKVGGSLMGKMDYACNGELKLYDGSNNENITLRSADGSATFANNIRTQNPDNTNNEFSEISNRGRVVLNRIDAGAAVEIYNGTIAGTDTGKIRLYSNGSASFSGAITADNVTFNLEADDDTKYTATTNEEGEQTLVYNGATLDVKELLLSLQTAAARIEALEARLDAAGV